MKLPFRRIMLDASSVMRRVKMGEQATTKNFGHVTTPEKQHPVALVPREAKLSQER